MKKSYAFILSVCLLLSLAACGGSAATEKALPTEAPAAAAAVINPVHELSEQELLEATGMSFTLPEGAENAVWASIDGVEGDKSPIAQLTFVLNGQEYCCRSQVADVPGQQLPDISGLFLDESASIVEESASVGYNSASLRYIVGGMGSVRWYDYAPGILYSVSVQDGAEREQLLAVAESACPPLQREADGQESDPALYFTDFGPHEADLDGDGKLESVCITSRTVDEFGSCVYGIRVTDAQGTEFPVETNVNYNPSLWLQDLDGDGHIELLFCGDCGSDDYITYLWKWNGELQDIEHETDVRYGTASTDSMEGAVESIENGVVTLGSFSYIMGTYGSERPYLLDADGVFVPQSGSIWTFPGNDTRLETKVELSVALSDGTSALPSGSKLRLIGWNGSSEAYFETDDGRTGTFSISRDQNAYGWKVGGINEEDVFVTLPYAG